MYMQLKYESQIIYCIDTIFSTVDPPISDHPKCKRLSGCLWEVVVYKKYPPLGSLFREEVQAHCIIVACNMLVRICVVPCCH